nr:retrovirus-related Pol polyprotein from transposon TNT 1-94 [Tanacetum cinerariifolium]
YVKDNEVPVVYSDVSSVPTDTFMMIYDDMCEPHDQSVSYPSRTSVVKTSLTAKLATYKEHVELPRPHYNELNKVAIGYKNPLCLTRAKQIHPALNNGHEILKDNHAPAKVHNTKDILEMAVTTKKRMNDKMNDPECVTRKVKIAPHDYSKENFLATFTPQKQMTPEQIFWSSDLMKLISKTLKERTKVARPIKAFTVYPPNTPATLVPKVLTSKSQVKIHIFTLIQMFLEFDKTCNRGLHQLGLLKGEEVLSKPRHVTSKSVSKDKVKLQVLTRAKHAIDVEPNISRLRNNKDAHLDYLRHLKESVKTICDIVEEAKVVRPRDRSIVSACRYTKHSQELLELRLELVHKAHNNELNSLPTFLSLGRSKSEHLPQYTAMALTAYADADQAGCQDTRRSTSGSAQFLGDKLVSWSSKKQQSTAISTTKVEYIAMSSTPGPSTLTFAITSFESKLREVWLNSTS